MVKSLADLIGRHVDDLITEADPMNDLTEIVIMNHQNLFQHTAVVHEIRDLMILLGLELRLFRRSTEPLMYLTFGDQFPNTDLRTLWVDTSPETLRLLRLTCSAIAQLRGPGSDSLARKVSGTWIWCVWVENGVMLRWNLKQHRPGLYVRRSIAPKALTMTLQVGMMEIFKLRRHLWIFGGFAWYRLEFLLLEIIGFSCLENSHDGAALLLSSESHPYPYAH